MPRPISEYTDEELARVGGLPGSREDYTHTMEFRRRELQVQRDVADAQIKAAQWTMWSAIAVALSVVVTALGIWLDVIGLIVQ